MRVLHGFTSLLLLLTMMTWTSIVSAQTDSKLIQTVSSQLSVNQFELITIDGVQSKAYDNPDLVVFEVPLGDSIKTIELSRHSVRSKVFEVMVQTDVDEYTPAAPPEVTTMRGEVLGEGGLVIGSVTDLGLSALVETKDDVYYVEPAQKFDASADPSTHVIYSKSEVKSLGEACGITEANKSSYIVDKSLLDGMVEEAPATQKAQTCYKVLQIALDSDNEFYVQCNSNVGEATARMEEIINQVSAIYERELGVTLEITTVFVRSNVNDPYTATGMGTRLDEMEAQWNSNHSSVARDVAHMFTGYNFSGGVLGLAYVGVICWKSYGYGLSQDNSGLATVVKIATHEIGHQCGASHCDGASCYIMCPTLGGCGKDMTQFGTAALNAINTHLNSRSCLGETCINDSAPAFTSDPITKPDVMAETNLSVSVAGNVTDSDSTAAQLTFSKVSGASWVTVSSDGTLSGYVQPFYEGLQTVRVQVMDQSGLTDLADVQFTVVVVGTPPVAVDDSAGTTEDVAIDLDVASNDSDPDGDSIEISSVTQGSNGAVTIVDVDTVRYTPNAGFHGSDSFTYTITDNTDGEDTATVSMTITGTGTPPLALNDFAEIYMNTPVELEVLSNDSDPDDDPIEVDSVVQPANGSVQINNGTTLTYTPDTDFVGDDTFNYTITDNTDGTHTAEVLVRVITPPSTPIAVADTAETNEFTAVLVDVQANDYDINGHSMVILSVTSPANGTAVLQASQEIEYTPNDYFVGEDTFYYVITDNIDGPATGTVTVTVNNTGNPPLALNDVVEAEANNSL